MNPVEFLQAVCATASAVAALFFLRFWRDSGDSLFAFFGVGFALFSLSWTLLSLINPSAENEPYVYGIRLIAFSLLIAGMINKNR